MGKRSLLAIERVNGPDFHFEMNKKKTASQIKADMKSMCGMLKADGSVTDALLRERRKDKKRESTKYGRSRRA